MVQYQSQFVVVVVFPNAVEKFYIIEKLHKLKIVKKLIYLCSYLFSAILTSFLHKEISCVCINEKD